MDFLYLLLYVVQKISPNKLKSCPTSQDFLYFLLWDILHYLFLSNFTKPILALKALFYNFPLSFLGSLMFLTRDISIIPKELDSPLLTLILIASIFTSKKHMLS